MSVKKKSYHHKNLREALVTAAVTIVEAEGVAGLTLRGVARAAGVSHTAPYRHFRDKSDLLEAIAVVGYQHLEAGCRKMMLSYPDDPLKQFIEAGMAYLYFVSERPAIAQLMFTGTLSPGMRGAALQNASGAAFKSLREIIEQGIRVGLFVDRPSDELTFSSLSCVHGLAMLIHGGLVPLPCETREHVRALGNIVARTLLDGLLSDIAVK